jgi:hypothetical protein
VVGGGPWGKKVPKGVAPPPPQPTVNNSIRLCISEIYKIGV